MNILFKTVLGPVFDLAKHLKACIQHSSIYTQGHKAFLNPMKSINQDKWSQILCGKSDNLSLQGNALL